VPLVATAQGAEGIDGLEPAAIAVVRIASGANITHHSANDGRRPVNCSSSLSPIRFGAVPTGVAMPPSDGAYEVMSRMATSSRRDPKRSAVRASGNSSAVVAVLLTHAEMPQPRMAIAHRRRDGLRCTAGEPSTERVSRSCSPCVVAASMSRNVPKNMNTIGSPKPANAAFASATPSVTPSTGMSSAVIDTGNASVSHSPPTAIRITSVRCAATGKPGIGISATAVAATATSTAGSGRNQAADPSTAQSLGWVRKTRPGRRSCTRATPRASPRDPTRRAG